MLPRPPTSTLFPYTTLFRSCGRFMRLPDSPTRTIGSWGRLALSRQSMREGNVEFACIYWYHARSEEHTSELQSQSNLVCRLLLEKKKKNYTKFMIHARNVQY